MHPDIDELRPKLKEILYDCAVEIKATKAALYLLDPSIRKFELVTEYGFRSAIPQSTNFNHPLVDRAARGRTPFYVNSVGADPKLSQVMFDASSERLLVAPMFSRGELVGLIDMRDKAGKATFEQSDVPKAQTVVEKILNIFATKNIFNQRFITLADVEMPTSQTAPMPAVKSEPVPVATLPPQKQPSAPKKKAASPHAVPAIAVDSKSRQSSRTFAVKDIVAEAQKKSSKIVVPASPRTFGEGELRAVRDVLRSVLYLPGSLVAAFTITGSAGGLQEVAAKNALSEEARSEIQTKLGAWLSKRGEATGPLRVNVQTPFGEAGTSISAAQLQKVYTAPVSAAGYRHLYLTVGFSEAPGRSTHELLAALLSQLQLAIEAANGRDAVEGMRSRIAARLLEPEYTSYPELRRHSDAVAARCAAFAQYLDLPAQEVETVTLTAVVHDVGMRFLDYDNLYTKRGISADELAFLREHVVISAAITEPLLGHEIARAVLCHHERVDGNGYPNELRGEEIPLASRILQICDAYVTLTDPGSYHEPETHEEAIAAINRGANAQFDGALVAKFVEMMAGAAMSSRSN